MQPFLRNNGDGWAYIELTDQNNDKYSIRLKNKQFDMAQRYPKDDDARKWYYDKAELL